MILFRPLLTGIAGDLCVEDGQAGLKLSDMSADVGPVLDKKFPSLRIGGRAFCTQVGVSHHVTDRHPSRFQAAEELDPG